MDQNRLEYLLVKWRSELCTADELKEIDNWFHGIEHGCESVEDLIKQVGDEDEFAGKLYGEFNNRLIGKQTKLYYHLKIAAMLVAICTAGILVYRVNMPQKSPAPRVVIKKIKQPVIKSGTDKAMLTLANGEQILLDDTHEGSLAIQQNTQVNKTSAGKIVYAAGGSGDNKQKPVYNTLRTPRGGKYDLILADGTLVMLDAESSITYPVAFNGNDRLVEISGQAYFQVVHNKRKPFKVKVNGLVIEDIGTEFNINSYHNNPSVKVTLAEGLVNVSSRFKKAALVPGQQAIIKNGQEDIVLKEVNVNEVIAWKEGWFIFRNETVMNVMKQAERWYDVDVQYEGDLSHRRFGGNISRDKDISELLESLKLSGGIQYKIEGRRVVISISNAVRR